MFRPLKSLVLSVIQVICVQNDSVHLTQSLGAATNGIV